MRKLLVCLAIMGCAEPPTSLEKAEVEAARQKFLDEHWERLMKSAMTLTTLTPEEDKKFTALMSKWLNDNIDDPDIIQWINKEYFRSERDGDARTEVKVKVRVINSQGVKKIHNCYFSFSIDKITYVDHKKGEK